MTTTVETLASELGVTPEQIRQDEIGGTFLFVHSIHEDRMNEATGTVMTHLVGFTAEGAQAVRDHYAHPADRTYLVDDDEDDTQCEGHESLRGDLMGDAFYCDGTCKTRS